MCLKKDFFFLIGEKIIYRLRGRRKENVEGENPAENEQFMQQDPREPGVIKGERTKVLRNNNLPLNVAGLAREE